jgi:hypothetical protein
MKHTIPVTVRRDKATGNPVLFYVNRTKDGQRHWVECFDWKDGHSEPSVQWMRKGCAPMATNDPAALAVVKYWGSLPGADGAPRMVQRLRIPR